MDNDESIEARFIQFGHQLKIIDLLMYYATGNCVYRPRYSVSKNQLIF
jgi:hypothetical protein